MRGKVNERPGEGEGGIWHSRAEWKALVEVLRGRVWTGRDRGDGGGWEVSCLRRLGVGGGREGVCGGRGGEWNLSDAVAAMVENGTAEGGKECVRSSACCGCSASSLV